MIFHRSETPYYYEPEDLETYTEHGIENGAKFDDTNVSNHDIRRLHEATKTMGLNDSLKWIEEHKAEFSPSTVVIDTDDGHTLTQYRERHPQAFISICYLNRVRHLNTLLNRANEELEQGGYLWCHCRTAMLKKKMILDRFPPGINWIVYFAHYIWHRVMPKIPATRWLYFDLTKGQSRTYNRVEVLGRMYRAGFEVIDEEFRYGEFFVLSKKIKPPIWNDKPTGSPIIKLRRVGKGGKLIGVYKFRTMYSYSEYLQPYIYKHNALQEGGKFNDDYRINFWGNLLRKMWLDELPMVINLLKGEIKLVGVRPISRQYYSLYAPEIQELRIKVKPGLLPPFYYDKHTPRTIEEVQESERKYTEAYLQHPFKTDWRYFWGIMANIIFRGKHSH